MEKKKRYILTFLAGSTVGFVILVLFTGWMMWQLSYTPIVTSSVQATGFSKIKPQLAGTGLSHEGNLTAIFTNGVGAKVAIAGDIMVKSREGVSCVGVADPKEVIGGNNFKVTASGCQTGNMGEVYYITLTIPYDVTIGGSTAHHEENGELRGPYE